VRQRSRVPRDAATGGDSTLQGLPSAEEFLSRDVLRIEQVKFFSWLETNSLPRRDGHFCAGSRIAADPGFAGTNIEHPKSPEFNAIARSKCFFQTFEDRINSRLRFVARQARLVDYLMDNVLFNQCFYPEGCVGNCKGTLRPHRIACFSHGPAASRSCRQAWNLIVKASRRGKPAFVIEPALP
jgi:hypothetical protein